MTPPAAMLGVFSWEGRKDLLTVEAVRTLPVNNVNGLVICVAIVIRVDVAREGVAAISDQRIPLQPYTPASAFITWYDCTTVAGLWLVVTPRLNAGPLLVWL